MNIIDFEEAKARMHTKEKAIKHPQETEDGVSELQRQYRELAWFYNQWYDKHVVGQEKNGAWVYKNL